MEKNATRWKAIILLANDNPRYAEIVRAYHCARFPPKGFCGEVPGAGPDIRRNKVKAAYLREALHGRDRKLAFPR